MSSSTSTTVEQLVDETQQSQLTHDAFSPLRLINTNSTLPTHVLPPRAYTLPPAFDPDPNNDNRKTASRARAAVAVKFTEKTWFVHVEKYAPVIGIVIAVVAIAVTVVGIIVGVVLAVTVK